MSVDLSDMQARSKAGSDASKQGSYFGQNVDKLEDLPPLPKPSGQCCALRLFASHQEDTACLLSLPEEFCSSVCVMSCSACSACCLDNCTYDFFLKWRICIFLKHACIWVRSVWQPARDGTIILWRAMCDMQCVPSNCIRLVLQERWTWMLMTAYPLHPLLFLTLG